MLSLRPGSVQVQIIPGRVNNLLAAPPLLGVRGHGLVAHPGSAELGWPLENERPGL